MTADRPIYLDHQATTPLDPAVLATMLPFFTEDFGNPHATDHRYGQTAAAAIVTARSEIASLIGADAREIVFTSGATESNNLLIRGAARMAAAKGRPRIVTCRTEHKAVIEVIHELELSGTPVTWLDVGPQGLVDPAALASALGPDVGLVSIMAVNNEIGVIQPLAELAALCRGPDIIFHSDAAQAAGRIPLDVSALEIDLLSLSAHKLYGPKGIGAAYVRRSLRRDFPPLITGGGQEGGLRGGTLPTPLCVGFGAACRLAQTVMTTEETRLTALRDRLLVLLEDADIAFSVNGDLERRWPGNLNLSFDGIDAEALIMTVSNHVAIASGSACTTTALTPSHVILALGVGEERAEQAIRIGMGRSTSAEEIDRAAAILIDAVRRLGAVRFANVGG